MWVMHQVQGRSDGESVQGETPQAPRTMKFLATATAALLAAPIALATPANAQVRCTPHPNGKSNLCVSSTGAYQYDDAWGGFIRGACGGTATWGNGITFVYASELHSTLCGSGLTPR
jgi:hypothetical protein